MINYVIVDGGWHRPYEVVMHTTDHHEAEDYANCYASNFYANKDWGVFGVWELNTDKDLDTLDDDEIIDLMNDWNTCSPYDCIKYYEVVVTEFVNNEKMQGAKWNEKFFLLADERLTPETFVKWYTSRHPDYEIKTAGQHESNGIRHGEDGDSDITITLNERYTCVPAITNDRTDDFLGYVKWQM